MSAPRVTTAPKVVAVTASSPADRSGLLAGDELLLLNGRSPRDVIEYSMLVDEPELDLVVRRRGQDQPFALRVEKEAGEPLGVEVSSAVFDRVRTCDNHCEFCFIHQLPKGMRRSLSLKDDDYRLSFLYGNFTTLTRFTEMDLERVVTERLSPLFVSIHATDPEVRADLLRNRRGATSLRWLEALLAEGIEVHGQVVVCPGRNDGAVLHDTLAGVLDRYPTLATVACVPLGVSRFSHESAMRPHSQAEAAAVCQAVDEWQETFLAAVGRRMVFAADEYYLMAERPFPAAHTYEGFPQHENGLGMARAFEAAFGGDERAALGVRPGFFAAVDGAPPSGYRARRAASRPADDRQVAPVAILTGEYGARVLAPLVDSLGRDDIRLVPVTNHFFGGNIGVSGLLTGTDLIGVLADQPEGHRYLLPDSCLSEGPGRSR
jgi:putative radical SAM enzyme (TIGR03279 family)